MTFDTAAFQSWMQTVNAEERKEWESQHGTFATQVAVAINEIVQEIERVKAASLARDNEFADNVAQIGSKLPEYVKAAHRLMTNENYQVAVFKKNFELEVKDPIAQKGN